MDLIGIMKEPEKIIDAFPLFDSNKRGIIDEDELRSILRKYAPHLIEKEIEEILEKPNVTSYFAIIRITISFYILLIYIIMRIIAIRLVFCFIIIKFTSILF